VGVRAALLRRLRGPYRDIAAAEWRLGRQLAAIERRLAGLEAGAAELRTVAEATRDLARDELSPLLRAIAAEDSENRRRLSSLRASPGYESAFTDPDPLVSITVATCGRPQLLRERALTSILAQSYEHIEVVVVGDAIGDETAEAIAALDDPRVRYSNLTQRHPASDDAFKSWLVASTMARNEAMRLATGQWVVAFDDDDSMRPDHVEHLLQAAQRQHAEVSYGRVRYHWADGAQIDSGAFPPRLTQFSWDGALYHAGLRFFERELVAAHLGVPGDWYLCERMLRAGVRFHMTEAVVADVHPSERHNALRRDQHSWRTPRAGFEPAT
jgi:Glycosyl transferase family 2